MVGILVNELGSIIAENKLIAPERLREILDNWYKDIETQNRIEDEILGGIK